MTRLYGGIPLYGWEPRGAVLGAESCWVGLGQGGKLISPGGSNGSSSGNSGSACEWR